MIDGLMNILRNKLLIMRRTKGRADIETNVYIDKTACIRVYNQGNIKLCKNVRLNSNTFVCADGGKIIIGDNVSINRNTCIVSRQRIIIGAGTSIGPNVIIYDHDHLIDKKGFKKEDFVIDKVDIGENVWIAGNVCILKGSRIGNNCVIGAGCVVKGEIEEGTILTDVREHRYISINERNDENA